MPNMLALGLEAFSLACRKSWVEGGHPRNKCYLVSLVGIPCQDVCKER